MTVRAGLLRASMLISNHKSLPSRIAFPWLIGCSHDEGGTWNEYLTSIQAFAARHPSIEVAVVMATSDSISRALSTMSPLHEAGRNAIALAAEEPDDALRAQFLSLAAELGAHASSSLDLRTPQSS